MCSLPAGFPWPHLLPAAKTHTTDTRPHPRTGNPQGPPALTGRCQRPPRSPGLAGLSPGLGTTGMAPLPGFCKCEVQSYSLAENGANILGSPGRRRSCPSSKSSHTHSQKGPRKSNFSVLQPGYVPEALREASVQRGPLLDIWGLYLAPDLLSRGQRVPCPPPPEQGAHMRLLGGILRPSRNQVTCGRGKLAMRGARMTAASPWETLWCFSPSSKLPMSAEGGADAGVRGRGVGRDCPAPGAGMVAAEGKCRRMTTGPGHTTRRPPLVTLLPRAFGVCSSHSLVPIYP